MIACVGCLPMLGSMWDLCSRGMMYIGLYWCLHCPWRIGIGCLGYDEWAGFRGVICQI